MLMDPAAPPLPSLITPTINALLAANVARTNTPSATTKKATKGRMRVSKSRTARNLYAHVYMKDHPTTTTEEFDQLYKALSEAELEEYNAMHRFATQCKASNTLEDVVQAYLGLGEAERAIYMGINVTSSHTKGNAKGKGKARA
ncbi:hypothetical protein BC628DRAFT_1385380 [Trametes gibbosa]|nr:hypothetical protein BC628DRAFT_1385380 [Trametes gibbosa]